ncbi:uncharacterized protein LOC110618979 [Manihot esculenta]|uniref:uncharacterized protein LOC110618979 n=1 Tax=Manihot esculenta TaxID=3983 RepID=UPI000B5D7D14|nr:uncharacterized protein LOC110618979 [Manihot esculenta]
MADKIHPTTTITNIMETINLMLDYEYAKYNNWAMLFTIHAKAILTYDHIDLPTVTALVTNLADWAQWDRIDNIVRRWIYGTISDDLLNTLSIGMTWLPKLGTNWAYTRRLTILADQLDNVGAELSDLRMVIHLLTGLTDAYSGFVTVVQNKSLLPMFP